MSWRWVKKICMSCGGENDGHTEDCRFFEPPQPPPKEGVVVVRIGGLSPLQEFLSSTYGRYLPTPETYDLEAALRERRDFFVRRGQLEIFDP